MNLYDVKKGDKILCWSYHSWSIREVERVTLTQIIIGKNQNRTFRKSDGYEVGSDSCRNYIKTATPDELVEHDRKEQEIRELMLLRAEVGRLVDEINPRYMDKSDAEELICFLKNEWKKGI